jgi:heme-degrading monooxygenase HmoA
VISRQWRGLAHASRAGDYVEFLVVTRWASMAAIREFAGNNAVGAVVPPEVRAMMIEYDKTVRHYEVIE